MAIPGQMDTTLSGYLFVQCPMPRTTVKVQKVSKAKVRVSAEVPAWFLTAFCPYMYLIPFPPNSSVCACCGGFLEANLRMPSGWDWPVTAWADMLYQGQGCWGSSSVWHDPGTKVQTADLMPVGIFSKLFKGNAVICKTGMWMGHGQKGGLTGLADAPDRYWRAV